jgi:nicotinate-nucleotide pyrophosphorylase (carboxylating)
MEIDKIILESLKEDIGDGDHTSDSIIEDKVKAKANLIAKENGIISGIEIAKKVFKTVDEKTQFTSFFNDGDSIKKTNIILTVEGSSKSILKAERLALNFMQRMSGIASETAKYVELIKGSNTKLLDTRKTTPLMRELEKMAVKHGGGENHRFGLYDMIMIKDNHIDFAGGVKNAIDSVHKHLKKINKNLKIEIEVRNFDELDQVMQHGKIHRIMLDNFSPADLKKALEIIDRKYETEASGNINFNTIANYAKTGVDYISVGALTHKISSLDLSLKAV